MDGQDDTPEIDGRTFRPYLLTGGRTRPSGRDIPIEALIVTRPMPVAGNLTSEQALILGACHAPMSVAEIAVVLNVPIGVARVLVGDLAEAGHVEVGATAAGAEYELVKRLIAGVRAI
jgi:hypothetical protein